jgi:hypothetical protein
LKVYFFIFKDKETTKMEFEFKIETSDGFEIMAADVEDFKENLFWDLGGAQSLIAEAERISSGEEIIEWLEKGDRTALNYMACRYIVAQAQPPNA